MRAEQITASVAYHAEGPVWWEAIDRLRFVDMLAGDVMTVEPGGAVQRTPVGSPVVAVLRPRAGGGAIVGRERDVAVGRSEALDDLEPIATLFDDPALRNNEGACDPDGRFYCGSMAYEKMPGVAALYRIDGGGEPPREILSGVSISNGLGWSPDGTIAYYNDTPSGEVATFAYDRERGLYDRGTLARFAEHEGHPDGLCVDAEGGIWVAMNHAGAVRRYSPAGALAEVVELPVSQVTACTFGGPDYDTLYMTTSREGLAPDDEPEAGSIYAVRPGVRGLPPLAFTG